MDKRRIVALICILCGAAMMAVPFFYQFRGNQETDRLLTAFEQEVQSREDKADEEETDSKNGGETTSSEADAALQMEGVIGIVEIEAIDLRYPIVEGAGKSELAYAIGHITETAGIGKKGNCVLAGHNGSRNGTFFTKLNQLSTGDTVKLTDKEGQAYEYLVAEITVVEPYDNHVKAQGEEELLTLLTCADSGTRRLICKCVPKEKQ